MLLHLCVLCCCVCVCVVVVVVVVCVPAWWFGYEVEMGGQ